MLAQIRKAIVAGLSAGTTAAVGALAKVFEDGRVSVEEFGAVVGAFLVMGAIAGYVTFKVPNADPK